MCWERRRCCVRRCATACRVLLASTSEVYGKGSKIPFSEDDDVLLGPTSKSRWGYAASKMVDEFLGLAYYREHDLPVVPFRLFNTTGPRQSGRYGMVLPRFVGQALRGEPITIYRRRLLRAAASATSTTSCGRSSGWPNIPIPRAISSMSAARMR